MTDTISADFDSVWALPSDGLFVQDAAHRIKVTLELKNGAGKVVNLQRDPAEVSFVDESYNMLGDDSGFQVTLDSSNKAVVYIVALKRTVVSVHFLTDDDPDTSTESQRIAFISNDPKGLDTTAGPINLPTDEDNNIALGAHERSIALRVSSSFLGEYPNPKATYAVLVNNLHCKMGMFDSAVEDTIEIPTAWLNTDIINKFAFLYQSNASAVIASPVAWCTVTGEIDVKPEENDKRILNNSAYMYGELYTISAPKDTDIYVKIPKGNNDNIKAGDTFTAHLYINAYKQKTNVKKNGPAFSNTYAVSTVDIATLANSDVIVKLTVPAQDLIGWGMDENYIAGKYYLDYDLVRVDGSGTFTPKHYPIGSINTVGAL